MFKDVLTGITAYISTSIDYLVILMIIFGTVGRQKRWQVYLGDLVGTAVLVAASLICAFVLKLVPEEWVLGLLGLIPIFMGVRLLIAGEDDDDSVVESRLNRGGSVVLSVAVITIATCGADNIGIYVPMFAQMNWPSILTVLVTFLVMLTLFCFIGYIIGRLPVISTILEKWGSLVTAIVYIGLGIFILVESGTIAHFIG